MEDATMNEVLARAEVMPPDMDLKVPRANANPWPKLKAVQDADPVFWSDCQQAWFISRHEDVKAGFMDRRLSADRVTFLFGALPEELKKKYEPILFYFPQWVVLMDAPRHTRVRKLLLKGFTKPIIDGLADFTQGIVDELLDEVEVSGTVEFITEYAFKLPAYVIMHMLGVPRHMYDEFKGWSLDMARLVGAPEPTLELLDQTLRAVNDMNAAISKLIAERRAEPKEDLLTALIHAVDEGDTLNEDELLASCQVLMLAGHETTINMLGNGLLELIRHRAQWEQLRDNPEIVRTAIEELLRYNNVVGSLVREALEDFEWHGKQIKKGDVVYLMAYAANRDLRVYEDPDTLNFDRKNQFPLSFGPGIHFCLGNQLARMELEKSFAGIVKRFERAEILDDELDWNNSIVLRGMNSFNVKFHPKTENR
ncbi:MAG TPA: cytochrome P450 [Sneathiellales bacterium]|nr:cytochrome P450 [Sneathiellales bacterium]